MIRQPTHFITHGGGPCFWMEFPPPLGPHAFHSLRRYFEGLLASLPQRPRAILVVSGHWEERVATVSTSAAPEMLYDYSGFPPHTYTLRYPAPGAPDLARDVSALLDAAGIANATDATRGFDHGVFVPLMIIAPDADIPVLMVSLRQDLDPAAHLALGRALAPLRDENVMIVGSGSSFHNLRTYFDGDGRAAAAFDAWLTETLCDVSAFERAARLADWSSAPSARACHPRAEHLIPLMVAAGAAGDAPGHRTFHDMIGGKAFSCFAFGEP